MTVNQEGITITPEGMARIEQRHEGKAALLEQMRREREAQYAQRHSHVGVELGREIGELSLISRTYQHLANMANYMAIAGKDGAGRTLASLALGLQRAVAEMYGKDAAEGLASMTLSEPQEASEDADEGQDTNEDATGQSEPAELSYVALDGMPFDASAEDVASVLRAMTTQEPAPDLEADEPHEGASLEVNLSPEPAETPQAKAARTRREAKAKAKQAGSAATGSESA